MLNGLWSRRAPAIPSVGLFPAHSHRVKAFSHVKWKPRILWDVFFMQHGCQMKANDIIWCSSEDTPICLVLEIMSTHAELLKEKGIYWFYLNERRFQSGLLWRFSREFHSMCLSYDSTWDPKCFWSIRPHSHANCLTCLGSMLSKAKETQNLINH